MRKEGLVELLLSDREVRVLGALIEKEITTPDYYPLSLNALTNACDQKSNRHPVMALDEQTVRDAPEPAAGLGALRTIMRSRAIQKGARQL